MKIAFVITLILAILIISGGILIRADERNATKAITDAQTATLKNEITALQTKNTALTNDNIELTAKAFPKPFSNSREMDLWLKDHKPIKAGTYYSDDAMRLLNEARNDGYWMGITAVKFDSTYNMTYPMGNGGFAFCIAAVADGSLYLVDPTAITSVKLMTMSADFKWDNTTIKKFN